MNTAIEKAITILGGQAALARAIGVHESFPSQWVNGYRPIPVGQCYAIEKATDGKVTRRDLRPDDWEKYWPELKKAA